MSSSGSTLRPLIQLKGPTRQSVLIGMAEQVVTVDLNAAVEAQYRLMAVSVSILRNTAVLCPNSHICLERAKFYNRQLWELFQIDPTAFEQPSRLRSVQGWASALELYRVLKIRTREPRLL